MQHIHALVINLLSDVLQVDIPPEIDDLRRKECDEWDSVNHLRLIMELEELLGITLDEEEALELSSLLEIEALFVTHNVNLPREIT